jgi:hypothetical protein
MDRMKTYRLDSETTVLAKADGEPYRYVNRSSADHKARSLVAAGIAARVHHQPPSRSFYIAVPDDEELCEAVAAALTANGLTAEADYTGGGIWCVSIAEPWRPNASWLCGMAAENWGGTLMEADSYAAYEGPEDDGEMQLLDTDVSSESLQAAHIAERLAVAILKWRAEHDATPQAAAPEADAWVAVSAQLVVGPFKTAADAARYIATRPPQANYQVLPLHAAPTA